MEEWRDVPGHDGQYQVSDQGRIRSRKSYGYKILKPCKRYNSIGTGQKAGLNALYVTLSARPNPQNATGVHRIVLTTFVGPRPPDMEGCHNDGNAENNNLSNLRWDTRLGNENDRRKHQWAKRKIRSPLETALVSGFLGLI